MTSTQQHTTQNGNLTMKGAHLFDVLMIVDDGRTDEMRIAADSEGSAKTRMMASTNVVVRGRTVEYVVEQVA